MTKETGGPAFPSGSSVKVRERPQDLGSDWVISRREDAIHTGLTLRDHFAGLAMQGLLSQSKGTAYELCATWAYRMADAMIEARK